MVCRVSAVDSTDQGAILTGSYDGILRLWNGQLRFILQTVTDEAYCNKLNPVLKQKQNHTTAMSGIHSC